MPLSAVASTSLFPIQIDANVGFACSARWSCVRPPRMNVVSAFEFADVSAVGSTDAAPGTATLLITEVIEPVVRR